MGSEVPARRWPECWRRRPYATFGSVAISLVMARRRGGTHSKKLCGQKGQKGQKGRGLPLKALETYQQVDMPDQALVDVPRVLVVDVV